MSIRSVALTAGILGAMAMFFLAWWLIIIGETQGPITLLERMYIHRGQPLLRALLYLIDLHKIDSP